MNHEMQGLKNMVDISRQGAERRWEEERVAKWERKHLLEIPHEPSECPVCMVDAVFEEAD